MFELRGVSKLYDGVAAVRNVDLLIPTGQTSVLIGPSGCGKSTLLRLMAGLLLPDEGSVLFDGTDIRPDNILSVRRRIGYVIQDGGLFPHLSAARNASIVADYLGWERTKTRSRLDELAELVQLPRPTLDRLPYELSGGQRQRVGLMRALMLDPPALLLDEPLGALDPIVRRELQDDLKAIFKRLGKTAVFVTHDLNEAAFFGDEVVLLRDGHIVQRGRPEELLGAPADEFARRFVNAQRVGTPA